MEKKTIEAIGKLHEPFGDAEQATVVSRSEDQNDDETYNGGLHVFPEWLYARRLDDVFANDWTSEISEMDMWGQTLLTCVIRVTLPDGSAFQRRGLPHSVYPFVCACELIGIGGDHGSILSCSRQLNEKYGFDWDIELKYLEEAVVCELTVGTDGDESRTRSGNASTAQNAFVNACEMFGINPYQEKDIPF